MSVDLDRKPSTQTRFRADSTAFSSSALVPPREVRVRMKTVCGKNFSHHFGLRCTVLVPTLFYASAHLGMH